jgi:putative transposase
VNEDWRPLITKGRKHGHGCSHPDLCTRSLCSQEWSLSELRQTRPSLASKCDGWPTASCPTTFILLLWPREDGDPSTFMSWLTMIHSKRWHAHHRTARTGHLYQGRYKSFRVQSDEHLLAICRYVERNARRVNLVQRAEKWKWGSLSARRDNDEAERPILTPWPNERPREWTARVNRPFGPTEEEAMLRSMRRGQPFGSESWQAEIAARLGLETSLRPRGRTRQQSKNGS